MLPVFRYWFHMLHIWVDTSWVISTCSSQLILVMLFTTKQTDCFYYFSFFFSFVGNNLCQVMRNFWTLLLHFNNQSFIMTIIEVIVANFVIKCIIWYRSFYDSRTLINPGWIKNWGVELNKPFYWVNQIFKVFRCSITSFWFVFWQRKQSS